MKKRILAALGIIGIVGALGFVGQQINVTGAIPQFISVKSLTIGSGPAMTQAPVMTWAAWIPATGQADNGNFWPPTGVTIQRILATFQTAPSCTVAPVLFVTDGTTSATINITSGANDSGVISHAFGSTELSIHTSTGTCTTFPADGMVTVQYQMN